MSIKNVDLCMKTCYNKVVSNKLIYGGIKMLKQIFKFFKLRNTLTIAEILKETFSHYDFDYTLVKLETAPLGENEVSVSTAIKNIPMLESHLQEVDYFA